MKKCNLMILLLFLFVGITWAQSFQSGGRIISAEDGEPIVGAAIQAVGTDLGTVSDVNGRFTLSGIPGTAKTLRVSYIGMKTQDVEVGQNLIIRMESSDEVLDEVVVIAYGTAKRESLTGAVSVVDSKKMEERVITSATSALEGYITGVQVNSSNGEPGAAPSINIRGVNTYSSGKYEEGAYRQGGDAPLYVVDGVPYAGDIQDINPQDIESISVLKDASAAALYGNRAANGVILITTKTNKQFGKTSLTLSTNQGFYSRGIGDYDKQGVKDWMESKWISLKNEGIYDQKYTEQEAVNYANEGIITRIGGENIFDKATGAEMFDANGRLQANVLPGYTDLDWSKDLLRTGHRQEYNLSAATGGEKINLYTSLGYLKEKGYTIGSDYERYSARINATYTPNRWMKFGLNLSGSNQTRNYNNSEDQASRPFYFIQYTAPVVPIYTHDDAGNIVYDTNGNPEYNFNKNLSQSGERHIIYELLNNKQGDSRNTVNGQAYAEFSLPYGFKAILKGDMNRMNRNRNFFYNNVIGFGASDNGILRHYGFEESTDNLQEQLTWEHSYGKHHVDVILGHENYQYTMTVNKEEKYDMQVEDNQTMGNFTSIRAVGGYDVEYKTEGYLARARYNYDERYYAELSIRRDGSSKFSRNHRWGNFYSAGANWNIGKERFMKSLTWVDNLKLRAAYGEVGNDMAIDYYGSMTLYKLDINGGQGALYKSTLADNNLTWETTQTFDIALEGRLFDRVNFSVDYFNKRSKDLLSEIRVPYSMGSDPNRTEGSCWVFNGNAGTVSNRGWELAVAVDILKGKDWNWNVGADATFLSNKVEKLFGGKDIARDIQTWSEGRSMYEYYTYHYAGVDQLTGQSLYPLNPEADKEKVAAAGQLVTINGTDYTTNPSTYGVKEWCGKATPDVFGSFHSTLSWRGFTLNTLFTYSLGGKVYDYTYQALMSDNGVRALHKDVLNSWKAAPAGMTEDSADRLDVNGIPQINSKQSEQNNYNMSDRWLVDRSYLALKNVTLTYRLPASLIRPLGIEGVLVKAGVENAFLITARKGLNPQENYGGYSVGKESNYNYVTARIINLGFVLNF